MKQSLGMVTYMVIRDGTYVLEIKFNSFNFFEIHRILSDLFSFYEPKPVGNDIGEKWLKFAKKIDHHHHFRFVNSKPPDDVTGLNFISYRSEMINTPSSGLVVALRTLNERDHWLAASSVACSTYKSSWWVRMRNHLVRNSSEVRFFSTIV